MPAKRDKKSKFGVRTWVVGSDIHYPLHDRAAVACLFYAIKIIRPYGYLNIGDMGECASVADFQWKHKKKPDFEYIRPAIDLEVRGLNGFLDEHEVVLKKAGVKEWVYCEGNHEERFDRLVARDPVLADLKHERGIGYGWASLLDLKRRGWNALPLGELFQIGKLRLYHGHFYGGLHHDKNHLTKMGVSVMYGHWHDVKQDSVTHEDGAKSAWCIGTLKSLHPSDNEWLGRRPINWSHAFAVVDEYDNGFFSVLIHWIIEGKLVLHGKVFDGNKAVAKDKKSKAA